MCIHYLVLYVDNILICATAEVLETVKSEIMAIFPSKDLGHARHFMGIKIDHNPSTRTLKISMPDYVKQLAVRFGLDKAAHKRDPISATHGLKRGPRVTDPAAISFYATAMGALLWPALTARPEIGFAVSMLSSANHFFTKGHMNAIKHIITYLASTPNDGITYDGRRRFIEHTFADANWGADHDGERKSQSGFIVMLAGGAISWGSKRQKSVALSTKEAEFYAISEATAVTLTTQQNLRGLGYEVDTPTIIFNDNQGIIAAFSDPLADPRPKHIDIKFNFARDAANNGAIILNYIRSADNWADIFTKALPYPLFSTLRAQILNSHSDVKFNNDNTRSGYSIQMPLAKTMIEDHCAKFDRHLDFQIWQERKYVSYANRWLGN
ncbi:reverse transcriptase, partial [Rhizoctonia solani AG-3 Rhs1AP]